MDLPKPVHGMSNINLAILNYFKAHSYSPKLINTAPSKFASYFNSRLWGFVKFFHSIFCFFKLIFFCFSRKQKVLYRPINGGFGQIYDLAYITLGRIFNKKLYIHHHSFNYINDESPLFKILNIIAGNKAIHIVLGSRMKMKLADLYSIDVNNIKVISNLSFFNGDSNEKPNFLTNEPVVIGHLANLCIDKGVDVFIDVCKRLDELLFPYKAVIAGPFADEAAKALIETNCSKNVNITYLGPLYGQSKAQFYSQLDCFIFPSKYKNEAEPLVLFEAAEYGNLLIGTQRGCMIDVIKSLSGYALIENEALTNAIVGTIHQSKQMDEFGLEAKNKRLVNFKEEHSKAFNSLFLLMEDMKNNELSNS